MPPVEQDALIYGPIRVELLTHKVLAQGKFVHLAKMEYRLLCYLILHEGQVLSRQEILTNIWNLPPNVKTRTLDMHIHTLRKKLGLADYLETVLQVGYRLRSIGKGGIATMKTEEKAKKVQNIATALAAIFGAVGAFFGIFQAQVSADLKNQVTSLQNASQQTIVNVISTLGDDAQAADLAQSGDTVAITEQLINVYNSTKDQNAALTSETQTLQSENAALQEQVENLKSVLLNTYSMDEIDTVVAQGYLDEVETKRLDNLELLDSERCEQVASVRDLYGTTHSVSYKFDPWQEAWAKFKLDGRYDTFEANILTSDDTSRDANISVEIYVDDVLVGRVDNIVRDENVRPISVSVNGGKVLMIKAINTDSASGSICYVSDTNLTVLQ